MDFAQIVASNLNALMEAPLLFIGALVAGYALARLHYTRQIETLREQAKLWKDRFSGASADEVRARLDALELAQRGKRLTEEQKSTIARVAKHPGGDMVALYVNELINGDAPKFARDLRSAFTAAGWRVGPGDHMIGRVSARYGLVVILDDIEAQSPPEAGVLAGLRAANVPFILQQNPPGQKRGAVMLLVCDEDN